MPRQTREKIGVVVIHGVGETYEGWINRYLIPNLEKWAAYKSVSTPNRLFDERRADERHLNGKLLPRPVPSPGKDASNDLLLVLEALDRPIAVALNTDEDFRSFCLVAGIAAFADQRQFKTRARRLENRDDLIYQISMIVGLQPAALWLRDLRAAGVPCTIAFDLESTVHEVRDPGSTTLGGSWKAFSRKLRLDTKDAIFTELYWADMSKVGETSVSRLSAMLQLFMESPFVLGNAFLKGCTGGIHGLIRRLILAANWVMHWPIAGLNVAIFQCVFIYMALMLVGFDDNLLETVIGSLLLSMIGGLYAFRKFVHRQIGLAYLALAGAFYAGVLLGILTVAALNTPPQLLAQPDIYLIIAINLALLAWSLWTIICALAAAAILLVAIKRLLPFGRRNIKVPPSRAAAALSLSLILGMMWKSALALLSFMAINTLVPRTTSAMANCDNTISMNSLFLLNETSTTCALASVKTHLIYINIINSTSIILFLLTAFLVVGYRKIKIRLFAQRATDGSLSLPRLIASPLIVAVLFVSAIYNALVFYAIRFQEVTFAEFLSVWSDQSSAESFSSGLIGIIVFVYLLRRVAEKSDGIVHIGRDLVDHQYDPSPRSLALRFQPRRTRHTNTDRFRRDRFRRRQRIQRRLEALIDDVIVSQQVDRLIFVAHSQGTVIMHDYLMNHDDLLHPGHDASTTLSTVRRIDALTLGSPLTHIYRHYFDDYANPKRLRPENPPLIYKVHSWVNMWRVDDPIAGEVDLLAEIENIGLGPGGHKDYWKEPMVCARIWQLIVAPPQIVADVPEEDPVPGQRNAVAAQ